MYNIIYFVFETMDSIETMRKRMGHLFRLKYHYNELDSVIRQQQRMGKLICFFFVRDKDVHVLSPKMKVKKETLIKMHYPEC
jgi:hypothetical protein